MNKVVLMGRLTRDPEVRYTEGDNPTTIARYTLAVDRKFKRDGEPTTLYAVSYLERLLNLQRNTYREA